MSAADNVARVTISDGTPGHETLCINGVPLAGVERYTVVKQAGEPTRVIIELTPTAVGAIYEDSEVEIRTAESRDLFERFAIHGNDEPARFVAYGARGSLNVALDMPRTDNVLASAAPYIPTDREIDDVASVLFVFEPAVRLSIYRSIGIATTSEAFKAANSPEWQRTLDEQSLRRSYESGKWNALRDAVREAAMRAAEDAAFAASTREIE